jgi:hypothetical protein
MECPTGTRRDDGQSTPKTEIKSASCLNRPETRVGSHSRHATRKHSEYLHGPVHCSGAVRGQLHRHVDRLPAFEAPYRRDGRTTLFTDRSRSSVSHSRSGCLARISLCRRRPRASLASWLMTRLTGYLPHYAPGDVIASRCARAANPRARRVPPTTITSRVCS